MKILFLFSIINTLSSFALQIFLTKIFSPDVFGIFSKYFSLTLVLSMLISMGSPAYLLKLFSKKSGLENEMTSIFFSISLFSIIFAIIVFLFIFFISDRETLFVTGLLFFVFSQLSIEMASSLMQTRGDFFLMAINSTVINLLRFLILKIFIVFNVYPSVQYTLLIFISISLIVLFFNIKYILGFLKSLSIKLAVKNWDFLGALKNVTPFGITSILYYFYNSSAVIFASLFLGNDYAGYYSIAISVMGVFYILPGVFYQRYFQYKLHFWSVNEKRKLYDFFIKGTFISFSLGVIIFIFFVFFFDKIFNIFFGVEYILVLNILGVLSIIIPFRYASANMGAVLMTGELIGLKNRITFLAIIFNITFILFLREFFGGGPLAIAYINLFCEIFICIGYFIVLKFKSEMK